MSDTAEEVRLKANYAGGKTLWHRWGPYLSERQWGTVREDYSKDGSAWDYFPHDHARSRTYRWGEDGIAGICDRRGMLCFALGFWNGKDDFLKERLYGLTNAQGNHGEDVKEVYFYLDNTPTHSYMKYLYKYTQRPFPYADLLRENHNRTAHDPEYEIFHTDAFAEDRYFDIFVEYAKASPDDISIRITAINRGPETAPLWILPTLWYRNDWIWNKNDAKEKPLLFEENGEIRTVHPSYGKMTLQHDGDAELLFTENETNFKRLFGTPNAAPFVKDAFHDYVCSGEQDAVNPEHTGTKATPMRRFDIPSGGQGVYKLHLTTEKNGTITDFSVAFDSLFDQRIREADEFYLSRNPDIMPDLLPVQRQAFAGLLWNKQRYAYDIHDWSDGDSAMPSPPKNRKDGRNHEWQHFSASEVLSMPDKWEYPWFAAWDMAFHTISLALIDPQFAKDQLIILLREWYMHPNGQIPAYEWNFSDVNPPVHAWAALRVYQIDRKMNGVGDTDFLERVFQKLLLNFTWWVNQKDAGGNNVFEGGFLGLDNIGVFDRNTMLPDGLILEQCDGTSWMATFCLNLLQIALELARVNPVYEDVASKFFEHFILIADALNHIGDEIQTQLWDDQDGFYYDTLRDVEGNEMQVRLRSLVGVVPLFAVMTLEAADFDRFPGFRRRTDWFLQNRPGMVHEIANITLRGQANRHLLALVPKDRLRRVLSRVLDETEFLSDYGIRSVSAAYRDEPFSLDLHGQTLTVSYTPAESDTGMFGGNSNWRGPIWFPLNYLLIESLQKFDYYYGQDFKIEYPTGSGQSLSLWEISVELSRRLIKIYERDGNGNRPVYGGTELFQKDPHFRDYLYFYEYFHGDCGAGLGASQQTGWTALLAKLIQQSGEKRDSD